MAGFVKMGWYVGANGYKTKLVEGWGSKGGLPFGMITLFGENGWGELHLFSLVWLCWAAAMVSKTLKVSYWRAFLP